MSDRKHIPTLRAVTMPERATGHNIARLSAIRRSQQERQRFNTSSGYDFGGGMTARLDLGFGRASHGVYFNFSEAF